ncbi:hypothetical protein ID866_6266, partial [Astraeus odoratus]
GGINPGSIHLHRCGQQLSGEDSEHIPEQWPEDAVALHAHGRAGRGQGNHQRSRGAKGAVRRRVRRLERHNIGCTRESTRG